MSVHEILIAVMAAFAVLGAVDRILGNRFGLGKEFEEGIRAMGSLAMAMLGIITLAPVLASLLKPVVVPVFSFLVTVSTSRASMCCISFTCTSRFYCLNIVIMPQCILINGIHK